jgi:hypothetical protein
MSLLSVSQSKFDKELVCSRVLTKDDYIFTKDDTYKYFSIDDKIVCFFDGHDWLNIHLDDMLAYPVLYFDFWSEKDDTTYVNSLIVCPITMRSMIYKGKMKILDIVKDNLHILNTDTDDDFFMSNPYTGHTDEKGKEKKIKSHVKRHEVKILTLRDCYMSVIDPKFIVVKNRERKILFDGYYSNRYTHAGLPIYTSFHPKTIVYMVQYYSQGSRDYRYTVIIGKDINKDIVTGYNYKTSGMWEFIEHHKKSFIEKRAYIYPIFWFMVEKMYEDVAMILIS